MKMLRQRQIVGATQRLFAEIGEGEAGDSHAPPRGTCRWRPQNVDLDGQARLGVGQPPPQILQPGIGVRTERREKGLVRLDPAPAGKSVRAVEQITLQALLDQRDEGQEQLRG